MPEIVIKQGASLLMQWTCQNDDGTPADLTNVVLASQVRTVTGDLVTTLPIVRTGAPGVVTIEVDDTVAWPVGGLLMDIKATIAGVVDKSETRRITVLRAVTA